MNELMGQINIQMLTLPPLVQYWMNWMGLIFFASLFFVWKKKAARYVFLSIILTLPIGLLVFRITYTVHLMGIAHFFTWCPLFYYLWKIEVKSEGFRFKSIYGLWVVLLLVTIVISLVFDIRDIVLVMMRIK